MRMRCEGHVVNFEQTTNLCVSRENLKQIGYFEILHVERRTILQ